MEIEKILNYLSQDKSKIINVLCGGNWQHFRNYFFIRDNFLNGNLDKKFESVFCGFYILNGPGGMDSLQKEKFFELLSSKVNDLRQILYILYEVPGYKESHRLFLSFGSKLIHTVNNDLPIYDRNIARLLKLRPQMYYATLEERIDNRIGIYQELKDDFNTLLSDAHIRNYLKNIRQDLQSKAECDKFNWQDKFISDTKLLDSVLWALYTVIEN